MWTLGNDPKTLTHRIFSGVRGKKREEEEAFHDVTATQWAHVIKFTSKIVVKTGQPNF